MVLLIIAVVTIGVVQESGIIGHAQKAGSDYRTKADEEDTILDGYLATIEENLPGASNGGENNPADEEIMWVYETYQYGDYEPEYYLYFIGNVTELELTEDKEIKAYVGVDNDGEIEYDENQIVTVKLSEVTEAYGKTYVEKLTVGEAAKNVSFNTKELVVLGDMTEIPENYFNERGIENLVIQDGVENIGEYAFSRNNLKSLTLPASVTTIGQGAFGFDSTCKIYYGGTQEQWNAISSAFPNDIEVIIGQE